MDIAEEIRVRRIEALLVQVADVAKEAKVDFALVALDEAKSDVRDMLERFLLRRCRGRRLGFRRSGLLLRSEEKVGVTAVGDPDASVAVSPGLSEETRRLASRPDERDSLRGVGRTVAALARL